MSLVDEYLLTIQSDHAVTISVSGLKESLGLGICQGSGSSSEHLQEQPGWIPNQTGRSASVYSMVEAA